MAQKQNQQNQQMCVGPGGHASKKAAALVKKHGKQKICIPGPCGLYWFYPDNSEMNEKIQTKLVKMMENMMKKPCGKMRSNENKSGDELCRICSKAALALSASEAFADYTTELAEEKTKREEDEVKERDARNARKREKNKRTRAEYAEQCTVHKAELKRLNDNLKKLAVAKKKASRAVKQTNKKMAKNTSPDAVKNLATRQASLDAIEKEHAALIRRIVKCKEAFGYPLGE